MKNNTESLFLCPCGSGKPFKLCCQRYIDHSENAPTAESLMRSRYTAFVLLDGDYLRYSWHPDYCPANIHINKEIGWLGLKIKNVIAGGVDDETGEVEFVARSKINGRARRLHETSRFTRVQNRWVYIHGKIFD
jgi:SEC-C motif domain protein